MRQLIAPTEDFIKGERTTLSADVSAGSGVTLNVEDASGYAADDFIAVGREGADKAELCKITSVPGNTSVVVQTLRFPHKAGEGVRKYRFDKRKFYGAATADGAYSELTGDGSPAAIQIDDPQGTPFEYTGTEYEYFKATYYNSVTLEETDEAESDAVAGDQSGRYASVYGIRKMAGYVENVFISDGRVEDKRRQAENEINSVLVNRYVLPLSEVPPLITYVCECLAAGYLHFEEYGPEGEGVKKLGEGRGILKKIEKGEQKLIGANYAELETKSTTARIYSKPDGTETGDEERKFGIGDRY